MNKNSKPLMLRITDSLRKKLEAKAREEKLRSANQMAVIILEKSFGEKGA